MIERTCINCAATFKTYKCYIERGKRLGREEGLFCSRTCRSSGKFHPKYNGGIKQVKRNCEQCKQPFTTTVGELRYRERKYCSMICTNQAKKFSKRGFTIINKRRWLYLPDHPKQHEGYYAEHRYVVEHSIGRVLRTDEHVHHIDRNKDNNKLENLVILTQSEHAREHAEDSRRFAKKYWTDKRRKERSEQMISIRKNKFWSSKAAL